MSAHDEPKIVSEELEEVSEVDTLHIPEVSENDVTIAVEANQRKPLPLGRIALAAGLAFSIVALLQIYAGRWLDYLPLPSWERIILAELILIGFPPLLIAKLFGFDLRRVFRLKKPKLSEIGLVVLISPVASLAAICAGVLALVVVKRVFGAVDLGGGMEGLMDNGVLPVFLAVAVSPAICEELMFRGLIQRGLEPLGGRWAVFFSGLLFGLFHFDFQRFAAQTLLGWVIAYVVYRTGSIINGMLIHFLHNGASVLMMSIPYLSIFTASEVDIFSSPDIMQLAGEFGMSLDQLLNQMIIGSAIALFFSLLALFGLFLLLRYVTGKNHQPILASGRIRGFALAIPGVLLIFYVYTAIAFHLSGNNIGQSMMRMLGLG